MFLYSKTTEPNPEKKLNCLLGGDRKHANILSDIRKFFVRDEATKNMKRTVKKIVRETADEVARVSRTFQQQKF